MSQQPPNSQPPSPEPESQNSAAPSRRVTQPAQTQANSFSSVLKTQTVKFLRGTIRVLEGAVTKLETEPPPGTTQPSWWSAVLGKIRSLLPENLSSKFSDTALTGIIAGITVILVWTTSSLLFGKPPEVATVPPTLENPPEVATAPTPEPENPPEVATVPPISENPPEVATAPTPEPEPTPTIPTPPELSAPAQPEPVEETLPQPEPTPTPVVELTPEQTLIAAIEDRISQISNDANGLIQSIQVNFEGSSLTVKIGSDWYKLKPSEQDNLAAQMLERSRELDFSRLEITDTQGTLLARSPVVGKDMIILNRGSR